MKLKKIASLALAGIMAVSMLAGCKSNPTDPETPNEPTTPVAGAAAYANAALDNLDNLVFDNSSWLDSEMADITADVKNLTLVEITDAYNRIDVKGDDEMLGKLRSSLNDDGVTYVSFADFGTARTSVGSVSWGNVYTVSGKMDMESAVESVAKMLDNALNNHLADTVTLNGATYDCDYTGEISALKVSNKNVSGASAWVITVVIEQNVTKSANTQV